MTRIDPGVLSVVPAGRVIATSALAIASLLIATLPVATLRAQKDSATSKPSKPAKRQKVVVIGASVSSGFVDPFGKRADGESNHTYTMQTALKKAWPREVARVYSFSDLLMFQGATKSGPRQVGKAIRVRPDLVIGFDYLFWYGYGWKGNAAEGVLEPRRLKLQAKGFASLESLTCPVILGDYPDMHGADKRMLPPQMIPNVTTLAELNKRLLAWAAKRKNVVVISLAAFLEEAVNTEQVFSLGQRKITFPKKYLLQSDRLHVTRLGMLVAVLRLQRHLGQLLPRTHPLVTTKVTFQSLLENAGIEDDLPEQEKQKQ